MTRKKLTDKEKKVGLRLTLAERKLILKGIVHLPEGIAQAVHAAPAKQPIMMILHDWKELSGHIAAEANNAGATMLQKKFDTIFLKIQESLETHTAEMPPRSLRIKDASPQKPLAEESVQLAEWAAKMLIGAEQLGIKTKPVARLPLPGAERAVLMMTPTIDEKIRKKLAVKSPRLTVGEVGGLLMAVAEAMLDAAPLKCFGLIMTARSLKNCLEAEVTGR